MFWLRNKKIIFCYAILTNGLSIAMCNYLNSLKSLSLYQMPFSFLFFFFFAYWIIFHAKPFSSSYGWSVVVQGISYLSEVGARGLLNLGKKAFGTLKLGKFDAV